MSLLPQNLVAEVRDKTDIASVIGDYVQLRRVGASYIGLCPFHQEKTPSFHVSPAKQFFYCFGCQKSGDVFRFLMDHEGRRFVEVVKDLAARVGVSVPDEDTRSRPDKRGQRLADESERSRILKVNALAAQYYETQLEANPRARHYLTARGIGESTQKNFRLGYAPESWDGLVQLFRQRGVPHELGELAGFLVRRETATALFPGAPAITQTHYDRFRDRLMCPLLVPVAGRKNECEVIAFSGRLLPSEKTQKVEAAKYINSPETPLFRKGQQLFGLHLCRQAIAARHQIVLVEGNFDVLSLHEHGFANTLATLGTALTETQVIKLAKLLGTDGHVVLMLDGDKAGREATMRDISLLFSASQWTDMAALHRKNIDVRVARLPDGEDPDSLARRDAEKLGRLISGAQPAIDYVLDELLSQLETKDLTARAKIISQLSPLIGSLASETLRNLYVGRLATALAVDSVLLWRQIERAATSVRAAAPSGSGVQATHRSEVSAKSTTVFRRETLPAAPRALDGSLRNLLGLLSDHPDLWDKLTDEMLAAIAHPTLVELLREAREMCHSGEVVSVETVLGLCPVEWRSTVADAMLQGRYSSTQHPAEQLARLSTELRAQAIQREVLDLTRRLANENRSVEPEARMQILRRILELSKQRETLLHDGGSVLPTPATSLQGDAPR